MCLPMLRPSVMFRCGRIRFRASTRWWRPLPDRGGLTGGAPLWNRCVPFTERVPMLYSPTGHVSWPAGFEPEISSDCGRPRTWPGWRHSRCCGWCLRCCAREQRGAVCARGGADSRRCELARSRVSVGVVGGGGPAILGHADPRVIRAVQDAAARGLSFGAPGSDETELAELIAARVPPVA